MKILRDILIVLLAAILLLCGIIGLSALRPDLFEDLRNASSVSEDDTGQEAAETPTYTLPEEQESKKKNDEPAETVSDDTVSENEPAIADSYFSEDIPGSGLQTGLDPVYEADDTPLDVPSELRSQTGLTEPHGRYDILDDEEADEIESALSTGPTGDDLDFDALFYPYYHMLDARGQHLYRQIYANAKELNADFRAVEKNMPWSSFRNVFEAVFSDHPELFWLNTEFSAGYRDNGECLEIILSFNRTAQDIDSSASQFDAGANDIGNAAYGDVYEQERAVHDAMLDAFSYSLSAEMNQSAYSGFVNHRTVCAGYARAFQYIMQGLGIPCYYCRGTAGEPHAWNIIKLGDNFYNVDATWDDSEQTWQYEYFNLSDSEISKDHRRTSLSVYLPACSGGEYSGLEDKPGENDAGAQEPGELPDGTYTSDLEDYFRLCAEAIKDAGKGSYSFEIYTSDRDVYDQCRQSYRNGSAEDQYMQDVLEAIEGARGLTVEMTGEDLGGVYKMTHNVTLR